jgi:lipopolysaccharide/colanic/teichoic acid biosynthesis glycosyltransferase
MVWVDFVAGGVATWSLSRLAPLGHRWLRRGDAISAEDVIVIGDSPEADELAKRLISRSGRRNAVRRVGIESIDRDRATFASSTCGFEKIYIADSLAQAPSLRSYADNLLSRGGAFTLVPAPIDLSLHNCELSKLDGMPLLTVGGGGFSPSARRAKRLIDIAGSLLLITLLSPVLLVLSLLLWVLYGSPVLFRQERVGIGGEPFTLFKFRTMKRDAEHVLTLNPELYHNYVRNNYKLPLREDIRVTRLGRFLRAFSLDELPQLFNVLRGEMSLVGPRPVVPEEVEKFGSFAPLILSVQPGLTGLWQVKGRSLIGDYSQRVRLNVEYIRDGSIMGDLAILAKTLLVVLRIKEAGWEREAADVVKENTFQTSTPDNNDVATAEEAEQKPLIAVHQVGHNQRKFRPIGQPRWRNHPATEIRSGYRQRDNRQSD